MGRRARRPVVLIRPAPVPGSRPRSFGLPEFDPFWEVVEAGILVAIHASDSGYERYTNDWEGVRDGEMGCRSRACSLAFAADHQGLTSPGRWSTR